MQFPQTYKITQDVVVSGFTDGGSTSGYIDLTSQLPARAIVKAWEIIVTAGFTGTGITSAAVMVGSDGDTDRFSADTAKSCIAAGTIASVPIAADVLDGFGTAQTIRVTVTGNADFAAIKTAGVGAMTVNVFFDLLPS